MELFDEENIHTALADRWENYGTLNGIEDERSESHADSEVERSELLHQLFTMIHGSLDVQESDILCAYYGLQTRRLSAEKLALKHGVTVKRILHIVDVATEKLRSSDDAIEIWKYMYRK